MQITGNYLKRLSLVASLISGLILLPIAPGLVLAADTSDPETIQQPSETTGVGVTGTGGKAAPAGKPALAPPPKGTATPTAQTPPAKSTEPKEVPKGIGASAVTAGSTSVKSGGGGVSMGWKITGAVLGVGLIIGLAGGGGGGGGGGTSTTPTHSP